MSQQAYDAVAGEYAAVFDDIRLRRREWPWLERRIRRMRPQAVLDAGCGNGYLCAALAGVVPRLSAVEPCEALWSLARARLGGGADVRQAAAESLPFPGEDFDMVISLLSFRYMQWEAALEEIHRVMKPGGVFLLIDLFAASFNPFFLPAYAAEWLGVRAQHLANRSYHKKLTALTRAEGWQKMVKGHPKRSFSEALSEIEKKFYIKENSVLSRGRTGITMGLICGKK